MRAVIYLIGIEIADSIKTLSPKYEKTKLKESHAFIILVLFFVFLAMDIQDLE